jgi:hypothetical protein
MYFKRTPLNLIFDTCIFSTAIVRVVYAKILMNYHLLVNVIIRIIEMAHLRGSDISSLKIVILDESPH